MREIIGPKPITMDEQKQRVGGYGGQLLPGEGSAIAHYIKTNKRIPRRGEVGVTSEQIEAFEKAG